ncbi:hypothetical protein PM082_007121 [Marasmius tenuissimus]|nr:hypothetical protein PM082_007121 [Marasmius tenuissimus]
MLLLPQSANSVSIYDLPLVSNRDRHHTTTANQCNPLKIKFKRPAIGHNHRFHSILYTVTSPSRSLCVSRPLFELRTTRHHGTLIFCYVNLRLFPQHDRVVIGSHHNSEVIEARGTGGLSRE